jgi:hypothetical protein
VLEEVKDVVDDNTDHRGARMVFLTMNSIDILEQGSILMVIMTNFVERLYEDAIEQR